MKTIQALTISQRAARPGSLLLSELTPGKAGFRVQACKGVARFLCRYVRRQSAVYPEGK